MKLLKRYCTIGGLFRALDTEETKRRLQLKAVFDLDDDGADRAMSELYDISVNTVVTAGEATDRLVSEARSDRTLEDCLELVRAWAADRNRGLG